MRLSDALVQLGIAVVATVVGGLAVSMLSEVPLIYIVLAVLTVIAVAEAFTILRKRGQESATKEAKPGRRENRICIQRREDFPPLEKVLAGARELDVMGISLTGLATTYQGLLARLRDNGCRIRLITTDPENQALSCLVAAPLHGILKAELHAEQVHHVLAMLECLSGRSASGGSLEVALLEIQPPFGLFIIDGGESDGRVRLELYPADTPIQERPVIELTRDDGDWYTAFTSQFDLLWHDRRFSRPWHTKEEYATPVHES